MVWIKNKADQYLNLDKVSLLYIGNYTTKPHVIYAMMDSGEVPVIDGTNDLNETQAILDDLMKKIK